MKQTCLNYQNCSYYNYLTQEELLDLQVISLCPECNSLTVLTNDDFNLKETIESNNMEETVYDLPLHSTIFSTELERIFYSKGYGSFTNLTKGNSF